MTVILLDGLNTRFENQAYAKQQLMRFLQTADPEDRIALYSLGKSLKVLCDFDHPEELQRILAGHRGSVATDFTTTAPEASNTGSAILDQFLDQANQTLAIGANLDSLEHHRQCAAGNRRPSRPASGPQERRLGHGGRPVFGRRRGARVEPRQHRVVSGGCAWPGGNAGLIDGVVGIWWEQEADGGDFVQPR